MVRILGPVDIDKLRKDAVSIFEAGVKAADPVTAVLNHFGRNGDTLDVLIPLGMIRLVSTGIST